jgi:hypothetical protein
MAVTLVNLSGFQWGIESAESGINVSSFQATYRPEFKEFLLSRTNEKIGFAAGATEVDMTVEGEVSGALPVSAFTTAVTIANDHTEIGTPTGTVFCDEASVNQQRGGWRTFSAKLSTNAGIVLA